MNDEVEYNPMSCDSTIILQYSHVCVYKYKQTNKKYHGDLFCFTTFFLALESRSNKFASSNVNSDFSMNIFIHHYYYLIIKPDLIF
jgi:hypothetical protein